MASYEDEVADSMRDTAAVKWLNAHPEQAVRLLPAVRAAVLTEAAERYRCPLHDMPDCSPLLNGCSRVTRMVRELRRLAAEAATTKDGE